MRRGDGQFPEAFCRFARSKHAWFEGFLTLPSGTPSTVVTIDAMGFQRAIAEKIVSNKADYVLAVKDNQGHLLKEITDSFRMLTAEAVVKDNRVEFCGAGENLTFHA